MSCAAALWLLPVTLIGTGGTIMSGMLHIFGHSDTYGAWEDLLSLSVANWPFLMLIGREWAREIRNFSWIRLVVVVVVMAWGRHIYVKCC